MPAPPGRYLATASWANVYILVGADSALMVRPTGKFAAVAVGLLDSPGRKVGGFGDGLMASAIAIPAAMTTAMPRATGNSQRGRLRRRTTGSAAGGAYGSG